MNQREHVIPDIAKVASFAALIAVLGIPGGISVLGSVPITAQTLGVMLAGIVLGPRLAAASVASLLAAVALGAPLLAGGRGGLGVFLGPSGGFLIGWIVGALVIGAMTRGHAGRRWWRVALATVLGGIVAIYAVGVPGLAIVGRIDLADALLQSLVFLPGDVAKAVLAVLVARFLDRVAPQVLDVPSRIRTRA